MDFCEIVNGLSGMKRDIILRMCRLLWNKPHMIKPIIGMCKEHFQWKIHSHFVKSRPTYFKVGFVSIPKLCVITETGEGLNCAFAGIFQTIFLDKRIHEGVWRWTVYIDYGSENPTTFALGVAASHLLSEYDAAYLGAFHGSASFVFTNMGASSLFGSNHMMLKSANFLRGSLLRGVEDEFNIPYDETIVANHELVTIEADTTARTLSFFLMNSKLPRAISCVPVPFNFGMSGLANSFTSLSFQRLPFPTSPLSLSPGACIFHACFV